VVTTFSKGLTTLNSLTRQVQFFQTGTSGSDFNISSVTATHTFNIPDASASARGLITTGSQTIAGAKTFTDVNTFNNGLSLKGGFYPVPTAGDTGLAGSGSGLSIISKVVSTVYTNNLDFGNSSNSYAFPNASGTIALLSATQTFTSANTFSSASRNESGILLKNGVTTGSNGYVSIGSNGAGLTIGVHNSGTTYYHELLMPNSASYNYTFPAATGTLALTSNLSSYVPYTGATADVDLGAFNFKANIVTIASAGGSNQLTSFANTNSLHSASAGLNVFGFNTSNNIYFGKGLTGGGLGNGGVFIWNNTQVRYYTLPDADGTIALTTDLGSYLPLAGGTLTGALIGTTALFSTSAQIGGSSYNLAKLNVQGVEGTYLLDLINGTEGNWKLRVYNDGSGLPNPKIVFKYGLFFDNTENSTINFYRGVTFSDGYLALSTAGVDRINISTGGFVGIGNSNITYKLDITGTLRNTTSAYFATSSGSVGIGTTSPSYTLDVLGTGRFSQKLSSTTGNDSTSFENTSATTGWVNLVRATSTGANGLLFIENSTGGNRAVGTSAYATGLCTYTSTALQFGTDNNIRMTISSAGNILLGTTDVPNGTSIYGSAFVPVSLGRVRLAMATSDAGNVQLVQFFNPNGQVGNISTNGLLTVYGTSSDYRLKKDVTPMENALSIVNLLKPYTWKWKDDSNGQGFIAHELQEYFPEAVTGKKDGLDEDGNPEYQSLDASFIVATLTKAIQELSAQNEELKARLDNAGL
jgi:hypothetical protein